MRLLALVGQRFRVRAVMDAARMQRRHAGLDVVFTEEIAVMVEEELVIVRIAVKEWHAQSLGILLERTWQEAADHRALRDKGRVRAGRKMRARAHDWPDIAHVDLPDREVAFPADDIERVPGVEHL